MKISIIILAGQDESYLDQLLQFLKTHVPQRYLKEIVIINDFEPKGFSKIEGRTHAELYVKNHLHAAQKYDAAALQAKGDILYFLAPGYIPPRDFASRIIDASKEHLKSASIKAPWIKFCCRMFRPFLADYWMLHLLTIDNLMIRSSVFHQRQGFRLAGKNRTFRHFLLTFAKQNLKPIII